MKLVLLGAPGAGKGTQADIISTKLNIPVVATGNIFRAAINSETPLGVEAKKYIAKGQLVPDELVIDIVRERLTRDDCKNGFILDGFPRTIAQAKALDELGVNIAKVLSIEVADDEIVNRLSGRRMCKQCGTSYHVLHNPSPLEGVCGRCGGELFIRDDDKPNIVKDRLAIYHSQIDALVGYYKQKGILYTVDGYGELSQITDNAMHVLGAVV